MRILNVVTSGNAPFFKNQIQAQEMVGIEQTTLSLSASDLGGGPDNRSVWEYIFMYPRILRESLKNYDLIHVNNAKFGLYGLFQSIRPTVLTIWGSDWRGRFGSFNKKVAPYYDTVIVSSDWMSDYVDFEHEVIEFGFDSQIFRPIPQDEARLKVGWEEKETVILFPYSKTKELKNYPLARSVVNQADTDAELITLSGEPYEKMPYYMNASDVVLVTSKGEPGPGVVKEAALCNVPIVSTDTGFVADVLEGTSNSYVCNTNQDLVAGLNKVLSSKERSDARKKASEWSIETMGDELLDVYNKTIEEYS